MSRPTGPAQPPRYEREIEQLLRRSGHLSRRRFRRPAQAGPPRLRWDWQEAVLWGFGLSLLAFLLRYAVLEVSRLVVLAGVALIAWGYVRALLPKKAHYEKRWRGRVIDLPPPEPSWRRALRSFFRRR